MGQAHVRHWGSIPKEMYAILVLKGLALQVTMVPPLPAYLKLADMGRGCSPLSAWANLCSSFLPSNWREDSILWIDRPSGKSKTDSLEPHGSLCHVSDVGTWELMLIKVRVNCYGNY